MSETMSVYLPREVCRKCGWLVKHHPVSIPEAGVSCLVPAPLHGQPASSSVPPVSEGPPMPADRERPKKRAPWGHVSRRCVYCGKVGPRVVVARGFAHRRCIPKPRKPQ